jgi:serine protease Do
LTNSHVVENSEKIRVRFKDGKEYDAEVRGIDAQSDLAVLKISGSGFPTSSFADSDQVRVGEFAIAIGAPFDLDYTVTIGHVSAKGRSQIVPDPSMDQDFIQTDASINPGNSGGPLVNLDGEIIGINTMIRGLNTGIGFAIPSNLAKQVADKLIADGKYTRAWLGLEIRALSEDEDLRDSVTSVKEGVVVRGIRQDGPAAKSDLRLGDVITAVEGRKVTNANELRQAVRNQGVGTAVTLDVVRNDKPIQIKVKTAEWPDEAQLLTGRRTTTPEGAATETSRELGLTVKVATKELARQYEVEFAEGVIVTQVEPDGLAASKGVETGDIITEINQSAVSSLREYRAALKGADLKKGVLLNLVREGVSRLVVLKETTD